LICYFDASALVKRYIQENHSERVIELLNTSRPATSRLSEVEVASAIVRRTGGGDIEPLDRDRILAALPVDLETLYILEISPEVCARTYGLLLRDRLRASDSLQLASCLHLQERVGRRVRFVAYDDRLNEAALTEGLEVEG